MPDMANALKTLREKRNWTHDEAAERMGVSRGHFIKLERGERNLNARTIDLAAKAFGVASTVILGEAELPASTLPTNFTPPPEFLGARDLPVYAAVEGGPGQMVVSTDPIELVPRPWYLRNVKDGYAVLVVGDSMDPAFEAGDMAVVNPRLAPLRGTDVILVAHEDEGAFTATIKRLLSWSAKDWHLRQFNPRKDYTLPKREWPKALRVVGKYYGR